MLEGYVWARRTRAGVITRITDAIAIARSNVATAIDQSIDNFIDNALDVVPDASTITIRARRAGDVIEIHVIDEGPGLTEVERSEAFGRFWRAEGANPGGTGLGLAIVRQLAESSGGSAELRAADSGGIDAVVSLPVASPNV